MPDPIRPSNLAPNIAAAGLSDELPREVRDHDIVSVNGEKMTIATFFAMVSANIAHLNEQIDERDARLRAADMQANATADILNVQTTRLQELTTRITGTA
jgi:hypothetical protein